MILDGMIYEQNAEAEMPKFCTFTNFQLSIVFDW